MNMKLTITEKQILDTLNSPYVVNPSYSAYKSSKRILKAMFKLANKGLVTMSVTIRNDAPFYTVVKKAV